jgi:hypothetical protein
MGLILRSTRHPSPSLRRLDRSDNGLAAGVDGDVLDGDLLLAFAAIECLE